MARVGGVNIPDQKHVWVSLTHIFGVGRTTAYKICEGTSIAADRKVADLSEEELDQLRNYITANVPHEGDLRREVNMNIKRLMDLGCYRGVRHRKGLPLRGQRTKTNAHTAKKRRRKRDK